MNLLQKADTCYLSPDVAKFILRLAVGILVLLHGIYKLQNPESLDFIGGLFENAHLPAFLAYLIYVGEIVAPIMLIIGYKTHLAARLVAITLFVAILLVHMGDVFALTGVGGSAIELQLMYLFSAMAIAGLGSGKYSLDAKWGKNGN